MKLISTGRILDWFVRDLRMLRAYPGVTLRVLPISLDPYRPPGVWAFCTPGVGRPLLFRFPPPLHPLEAIAAVRGLGGLEETRAGLPAIRACYGRRGPDWLTLTANIAEKLFVTPQTVRLVYQMLTPLHVPLWYAAENQYDTWGGASTALWDATGVPWSCHDTDRSEYGPLRENWAAETAGDIEL